MTQIATWIMALVGPIVGRVLAALGLGVITYAGFEGIVSGITSQVLANVSSLPSEVFAICARFGFFKACAIVLGAYSAAVVFRAMKRIGVVSGLAAS